MMALSDWGHKRSAHVPLYTGNAPTSGAITRRPTAVGAVQFITVSRQVGAGGLSIPQRLMLALNATAGPGQPSWSTWDRDLIDRVASGRHEPVQSVEKLEESGYSWMDTFISGLGGIPEEFGILHQMEESIRSLAIAGKAILVGHGSVFMTRDIPGGVHIRLIAPLAYRTESIAYRMHIPVHEAAAQLKQSQQHWTAFLRRYWPGQSLAPDMFSATLNTALLDDDHLVKCIVALVS